jgi:hypothetical protein
MGTAPAAPEPQTAVLAGAERESLDAHLPTNLLDLDLEPEVQPAALIIAATTAAAPVEVSSQNDSERNDAGSALLAGSDLPSAGGPAAEPAYLEPAASALEPTAAAATDPSSEAHQASAPQQTQAPTRRGRPRKGRQEAQPETQPEAETPEQEQPSASENTGDQQNPASLLFSAGDDPFGIDPLL